LERASKLADVRVLPAASPTWCSPKDTCPGGRLRATWGAPSAVTPTSASLETRSYV